MPWTRDRETGELVGFSGPKETPESIERAADLMEQNYMHGYVGGEAWEVFAAANQMRHRARKMRAEQNQDSGPVGHSRPNATPGQNTGSEQDG